MTPTIVRAAGTTVHGEYVQALIDRTAGGWTLNVVDLATARVLTRCDCTTRERAEADGVASVVQYDLHVRSLRNEQTALFVFTCLALSGPLVLLLTCAVCVIANVQGLRGPLAAASWCCAVVFAAAPLCLLLYRRVRWRKRCRLGLDSAPGAE